MSADDQTPATADLDADAGVPRGQPVPYQRFAEVNGKAKQAAAALATATAEAERLRTEATTLRSAHTAEVERLKGESATAATTLQGQLAARNEELALARAGLVDQESVDVARLYWERLPPEGRPELAPWVATLRADPTAAPRGLQPFLAATATAAASGTTSTTQIAQTATTSTAVNGTSTAAGSGGGQLEVSAVQALTGRMRGRGPDAIAARAEYKRLREEGKI